MIPLEYLTAMTDDPVTVGDVVCAIGAFKVQSLYFVLLLVCFNKCGKRGQPQFCGSNSILVVCSIVCVQG